MADPATIRSLAERVRGLSGPDKERLIERMASAMLDSKAWPAVFRAGTAEELARATLLALAGSAEHG